MDDNTERGGNDLTLEVKVKFVERVNPVEMMGRLDSQMILKVRLRWFGANLVKL